MGGSPYRLQVGLAYGRSKYAPYYGVGNGSRYQEARTQCPRDTLEQLVGAGHPPDTCPPSGTDPGNPAFTGYRYYDYDVTNFPTAHLTLFRALSGPWSLFGGYQFALFTVRPLYHPDLDELGQTTGSQLIGDAQAGRLVGYDGRDFSAEQRIRQRYSELSFGVRFDTRDNEFAPTRGMLHDLSVRGAAHPLGSESTVWGGNANLRLYQRPIPSYWRLVLALRLVGDVTSSGAPFYLLSSMGPTAPDGLGGSSSIRGLLLHRFVGDVKVLGNAELRWRFLSLGPFEVGAVGGIDAGRVWAQLGKDDVGPVHVGAAAGLRIAWSHHFVIRADYGFGISEPYADGSIYLDFGELF
jgi:outer membrane protein assembly factor BamA